MIDKESSEMTFLTRLRSLTSIIAVTFTLCLAGAASSGPVLGAASAKADGIFCDPTYLAPAQICLGTQVQIYRALVQSYGSAYSAAAIWNSTSWAYCNYAGCVADSGYVTEHWDYPAEKNHSGFHSTFHGYYYG
jgi:hypothetical protein